MAVDKGASQKTIASLSAKIQQLYTKDSVSLDPSLDADLTTIMASETNAIIKALPEDSFRRLFHFIITLKNVYNLYIMHLHSNSLLYFI